MIQGILCAFCFVCFGAVSIMEGLREQVFLCVLYGIAAALHLVAAIIHITRDESC
jgi:hypothetical protein